MTAQLVTIVALMGETFGRTQIWPRVVHFSIVPLATGIVVALLLRHLVNEMNVCPDPRWWSVGTLYLLAAAIILAAVVAVSLAGPFGATCRRDLRSILLRFAPVRAG